MSSRFNAGRWILAFQALGFFVLGGVQVWLFPEQTCPYMAASRAVAEGFIKCPDYLGEHPVFEMYTFSLGKHLTLIGVVFGYFAIRGQSQAAIQVGLVYAPVATLLDVIPPWTWLHTSGVSTSLFPPIFWQAIISCALSGAGLIANARHGEWPVAPRTSKPRARMLGTWAS